MKKQKNIETAVEQVAPTAIDYSVNPTFKSKIGVLGLIVHILVILIGAYSIYYGITEFVNTEDATVGKKLLSILFLAMGGIIFVYGITALFDTSYRFDEDGLFIKFGMMKNKYPYKFMMKYEKDHKLFTYNCLSLDKRVITFRDGPNGNSQFHISPKNEEEFIKELKKHCKSLKIEL